MTLRPHGNGIGATGTTALAEALAADTTLAEIELRNNTIGDHAGMMVLATAVEINTSTRH